MKTVTLIALVLLVAAMPVSAEAKGLDTKVSVNFLETKLSDALAFLAQNAEVAMNLDPQGELAANPVTLKLADVTVRAALTGIATTAGLAWDERWGGVFVATKERLAALPKDSLPLPGTDMEKGDDRVLRSRLSKLSIRFHFDQTPLRECLDFVRTMGNFNLVVDPAVAKQVGRAMVSVAVSDIPVGDALALLLFPRGLTAEIRGGVVFVRKTGPRKEPEKREEKKNVPKVLDETKLEFNFLETKLPTVVAWLRGQVKYPIHLDPAALAEPRMEKFTLTLASKVPLTARQTIQLVAEISSLDWDIRWGGVFLARKERLKALPNALLPAEKEGETPAWETALRKRLTEKRLSLHVADRKLTGVIALIRDGGGVNILIEPKAAAAAAKVMVTLRVDKQPLRETLTLLLVPRGYTLELKNEVVVVRLAGV